MPCYAQYTLFTETVNDINAIKVAAKELGWDVEETEDTLYIGSYITGTKVGDGWELSSSQRLTQFMDEYASAKITRKAKAKGWQVARKKVRGEIRLSITR